MRKRNEEKKIWSPLSNLLCKLPTKAEISKEIIQSEKAESKKVWIKLEKSQKTAGQIHMYRYICNSSHRTKGEK